MKRALIFSCVIISESDENRPTIVYQRRCSAMQKFKKKKKKKNGHPKGFLKTAPDCQYQDQYITLNSLIL